MRKSIPLILVFALTIILCIAISTPTSEIAEADTNPTIELEYYDDVTQTNKTSIVTISNSSYQDPDIGLPVVDCKYTFANDYNSTPLAQSFGLACGTNIQENNSKYVTTNFDWDFISTNFLIPAYNSYFGENAFETETILKGTILGNDPVSINYLIAYEIDGFKNYPTGDAITYHEGTYQLGNEYSGYRTTDKFSSENTLLLTDISEAHSIKISFKFTFVRCTEVDEMLNYDYLYVTFDLPAIDVAPYEDGDVAYCTSLYYEGCEMMNPNTYLSFEVSEDLFKEDYGIVKNDYTYSWYYIVNDSASVVLETYDFDPGDDSLPLSSLIISDYPDIPYTIRGKLIVTSKLDGTKTTYYTNKITVQKYSFEIKTNNIYSSDVLAGKEYVYSLSINRGTVQLLNENTINWFFDYTADLDNPADNKKVGQNVLFAFPKHYDANNNEVGYIGGIEIDLNGIVDEFTTIILSLYRFNEVSEGSVNADGINVCVDESTRIIPSYDLNFNVPDNSAMIIGGDEVEIYADINEFYGDENFTISYVLSSNGTVADISETPNKLKLHAVQKGKATIICTATSELAGTFIESLTINILDKDDEKEIVFSESFHDSNQIDVYLNIGGFTKFLNYSPLWGVVNESNDNISFVQNEDGSISVQNADLGKYLFSVSDEITTISPEYVIVTDVESPEYKVTFNVENNSAMIVGGSTIDITPQINEVYGDENFEITYTISGTNYADDLSTVQGTITLHAISQGKVSIFVTATSKSAGTFNGTLIINILESNTDNSTITFDDSFHKTGNDLIAHLNIGGYTNFLNYSPVWIVQKEEDDSYVDFNYTTDKNGNAVLLSASKGYYKFSISDDIVSIDAVRVRVTNIDFATVAKKALPYIAVIMVLAIIIAIIIKHKLYKLNTVEKHLGTIEGYLEKKKSDIVQSPEKFARGMGFVEKELKHAISKAVDLDFESLGQHQSLIASLTTAQNIVVSSKKCAKKLNKDTMNKIIESLQEKNIKPSKKLAEELTVAIKKYNIEKTKSTEKTDAFKVDDDSLKNKKKKKAEGDYLEALKEFYYKGEEFDQTNDIDEKN